MKFTEKLFASFAISFATFAFKRKRGVRKGYRKGRKEKSCSLNEQYFFSKLSRIQYQRSEYFLLISTLFLLRFFFSSLHAQTIGDTSVIRFSFDAASFRGTHDSSRVDVYIGIPYRAVQFFRTGAGFLAKVELTLRVRAGEDHIILERHREEQILEQNFAHTSEEHRLFLRQERFSLPPGEYTIEVELVDKGTSYSRTEKKSLSVQRFRDTSFALSGVLLASEVIEYPGGKTVRPFPSNDITFLTDGAFLFAELYTIPPVTLEAFCRIRSSYLDTALLVTAHEKLDNNARSVIVKIPTAEVPIGDYTAELVVAGNGKELIAAHPVRVTRSIGIPFNERDLAKAIDEVTYIASPAEFDYLREKDISTAERRRRLLEFWKVRDINKTTPENECMQAYYERVDYANKNFRSYTEGWRTDRGMVYVYLGAPDGIDRRPFSLDSKPYEVWYYSSLNLQLVFVETVALGDYRLQNYINIRSYPSRCE